MLSQTIAIHSVSFTMDGHYSTEFSATITIHDNGIFKYFLFSVGKKPEFLKQVYFFLNDFPL